MLSGGMGRLQMTTSGASTIESTRTLLIRRVRFILVICFVAGAVFAALELWADARHLPPPFYVKMVGLTLIVSAYVVLGQRWAVRYVWPLSIAIICAAYVMTGISGMVSPSREYETTAVLFVGGALTTAAILPWGIGPQCVTLATGGVMLLAAVLWAHDSPLEAVTDPGAAVLIAFGLSVVTAREVHRYRRALRRELQVRRRTELALKQLNAQLEWRVLERTAELELANRALAGEIVERRRIAEALRASQTQLADIVDNSTAIISLKDRDGRYLLVNREFEHSFGIERSAALGRADTDLFGGELAVRLAARDGEVIQAGEAVSFERDLSVGSERRPHVCVKFPLRDVAGTPYGVGCVSTDIGRLKQLEEEVRCHQDELAHVLRLHTIGEMAAALAHEINQPLCAIANYAQGSLQRLRHSATPSDELLQALEQIAHEGLRAADILRGIRNLVKREDSTSTLVDLNSLAAEAVRVLEPQARAHGVTVRRQGPADMPPVRADGTQIEQVIINLILNGVEAIASATTGRREILVSTRVENGTVELAVTDTGSGIAPAIRDKLFTPFVTTKSRGLGLGLAISRSIVELHRGRLWVASATDSQTTFGFSLPIAAGNETPKRAA